MKNVHCIKEEIRRRTLIRKIEKDISHANEYADHMEYASEALLFAKSNAPIFAMHLKNAARELRSASINKDVFEWANALASDIRQGITKEFLFKEIEELDKKSQIGSEDFFHIKNVLILKAAESFSDSLSAALSIQKMRLFAENWIKDENKKKVPGDRIFFLEHALKLSHEQDDTDKRNALLKQMESIGKSEEDIVEIASEAISGLLLRLTNAVNLVHLVIGIDWLEAYESISQTEKTLLSDPGNIYGKMDDESKAAVRHSVRFISKLSHFSESSVAAAALQLTEKQIFSDITQALYTDDGREEVVKHLRPGLSIKDMHPDRNGHRLVAFSLLLTAVFFVLSLFIFQTFASLILLPALFVLSLDVCRFIASKCVTAHPLLCLKMDVVPDSSKTLVVIPALLTGKENALKIVNRLWEHGVHEKDPNIDFMILGDFKDSDSEETQSDHDIQKAVKDAISVLNQEAGREKYYYFQRKRIFNERDQLWMGRERKRGAIEDLNRLIVTGENRFSDESEVPDNFRSKYSYLLTMDSDTRILPGEIRKLIGMISHPLNREYGVIQPRMETIPSDKRNLFSEFLCGIGGTDHYNICACDFYQDVTGEGLFSGKGILNIRKFYDLTSEAFQENTVLSHDIIEGILVKAGYAGNRVMFESFPETSESYLKRLDRWTRGDWQLILYLFGRIRLSTIGRFKLLSNIIRSLKNASVLFSIAFAFWKNDLNLFFFALLLNFFPVFLNGFGAIKQCLMSFLYLPSIAYTEIRAAFTALYRVYISKKKRLEWVTAAESQGSAKKTNLPGIFASVLLLPGLFSEKTMLPSLITGVVFAFGKPFFEYIQKYLSDDHISSQDFRYLNDLSRSIWKYFEKYVPINGNGLPPDNVQLDPAIGEQKRTSPTNIGMYILSVIGACILGLIEKSEAIIRLRATAESLGKLETFKGLFFNWYDAETLNSIFPRYISSVDLGNLAAAFVTARNFLLPDDSNLSQTYQTLIDSMDLSFLYNEKRKLFRIGYDAESGRMSASHYDLFASEARILSYVSMAEKGIELAHWMHLARPFGIHAKKPVVLSWSGTMFEYMMPSLLLSSTHASLIRNTEKAVIEKQMKSGKEGIWGISESGYAAFDRDLNYQYQAFGISDLALSGDASEDVFSPYSVILSLEHSRESGIECLTNMQDMGLRGDLGFYEAIDMTKDDRNQIVYSYMTHHQGMSFIALTNLLTGNSIRKLFLSHPKEAQLKPLLSEKPFFLPLHKIIFQNKAESVYKDMHESRIQKRGEFARAGHMGLREGHLLFAGSACAYFEPNGRCFYKTDDIFANFWTSEADRLSDTLLPKISDGTHALEIRKSYFDPGFTKYELESRKIEASVFFTLNPENGHLLMKVSARSKSSQSEPLIVDHRFRIALSDEESMHAHPVFTDLFIKDTRINDYGWIYARKNRETLKEDRFLFHLSDGKVTNEKDSKNFYAKHAQIIRDIVLAPFEKQDFYYEIGLENSRINDYPLPDKCVFDRSEILLRGQMNAHIQFCALHAAEYRNTDRASANLFSVKAKAGNEKINPKSLWPLGLSGETPILLSSVTHRSCLAALKKLIRAHEFYRYCGISLPLVILHVREADYFTPLTDAINRIIASSHLCGSESVFVFSSESLTKEQTDAIYALSVMHAKNDFLKDTRSEKRLENKPESHSNARIAEGKDLNSCLLEENGIGGFMPDDSGYEIRIKPDQLPPRRWSNFLSNACFGAVTNDLGISNLYFENSRMSRITPFENNLDCPKEAVELYAFENGSSLKLTPGCAPEGVYTVRVKPGETRYCVETEDVIYETICFVDPKSPVFYAKINLTNKTDKHIEISLSSSVRFLLGTDLRDARFTRIEKTNQWTFAHGKCGYSAFSGFLGSGTFENGCKVTLSLLEKETKHAAFCIGALKEENELPVSFDYGEAYDRSRKFIEEKFGCMLFETGNPARNQIVNGFLKAQTLFSRYFARFGPYQPGGAFGMRDQMQDLLSIMYFDLPLARAHLILCASKQFEKGDGLHWWHMPASGVRTRISDDILFLPMIAVKYIEQSGDRNILVENVPFLKDAPIPENQADLYAEFSETEYTLPFYDHLIRAFKYVYRLGKHGLILMGDGDWNDGMNRIGHRGEGESVWLSEFFVYTAKSFLPFAKEHDKVFLEQASKNLISSLETHAWDGEWYLRAFDDDGNKIGSRDNKECSIDLISQAWSVIAGLDRKRCKTAMESARKYLFDHKTDIIRLLTPPFTGQTVQPGYIAAYPPGIRENGGQYTHAACWMVKAYAILGMADEAWEAFDMLLPINKTNTFEKVMHYGGEPYVIAADISGNGESEAVCGWTWYTGAAAWAERVLIEDLLGIDIRGDKVKMHALLPTDKESMTCTIRKGKSRYILKSKRGSDAIECEIELIDDGQTHEFEFPCRN